MEICKNRVKKEVFKMFLMQHFLSLFQKRHSSAHRSGYSCLEKKAGLLLRQLLSVCKADAFFFSLANPFNTYTTPSPPSCWLWLIIFKWHKTVLNCSFESIRIQGTCPQLQQLYQDILTNSFGQ